MLLVPLVLLAPVMMLIVAVRSLASHGPLGLLAAAGLLVAVAATTRWTVRTARAWWATTLAPERPSQRRARHLPVRR